MGDILRDIRGIPWRDEQLGWCHSGFLKGARKIWPEMLPMIRGGGVHLTGHSKGAAEMTIIAAMMVVNGFPPASLTTFGSPRAGLGLLGEILKCVPTRRFVNGADCVPSHPWPVWGYRHVGEEIKIRLPGGRFEDHRIVEGYLEGLRHV